MESDNLARDKLARDNAQDWHPRGNTSEELFDRNRVLLRTDPQLRQREISHVDAVRRIRRIIATSKPQG